MQVINRVAAPPPRLPVQDGGGGPPEVRYTIIHPLTQELIRWQEPIPEELASEAALYPVGSHMLKVHPETPLERWVQGRMLRKTLELRAEAEATLGARVVLTCNIDNSLDLLP